MKGASTYRAVQAVIPGKLELTELPLLDPPRATYKSGCHSNSSTVEKISPIRRPRVPGHEAVYATVGHPVDAKRWASAFRSRTN